MTKQHTENDHLLWQALGAIPSDSVDSQFISDYRLSLREHLFQRHSKLGDKAAPRLRSLWIPILTLAGALSLIGLQNARARNQSVLNEQFSSQLVQFALGMYDQNLHETARQAVTAEQTLPPERFFAFDTLEQSKMQTCANALGTLTLVRSGQFELAELQLDILNSKYQTEHRDSGIDELDLAFQVILTHSLTEASESNQMAHRNNSLYPRLENLQSIQQRLEDVEIERASHEHQLLYAANLIDQGRWIIKFASSTAPESSFQKAHEKFYVADSFLNRLDHLDHRVWIQRSRLLQNRALLLSRANRLAPAQSTDALVSQLEAFSQGIAETEFWMNYVTSDEQHRAANAMPLGIAYSNIADVIYYDVLPTYTMESGSDSKDFQAEQFQADNEQRYWLETANTYRERALELLTQVPIGQRSIRCNENIALNHARSLVAKAWLAWSNDALDDAQPELLKHAIALGTVNGGLQQRNLSQLHQDQLSLAQRIVGDPDWRESPIVYEFPETKDPFTARLIQEVDAWYQKHAAQVPAM